MAVKKEHRAWVDSTNNLTIEEFSIKFAYSQPQTAYDDFMSAITNSKRKMSVKRAALDSLKAWKDNKSQAALFWLERKQALAIKKGKSVVGTSLVDAAANELPGIIQNKGSLSDSLEGDTMSSPSTLTLSIRKRAAAGTLHASNKRSGIIISKNEHVEAEEDLDSSVAVDEHDVTSGETVVDDLTITMGTGPDSEDEAVAGGDDDDEEEGSEGEETFEDLIHELEALEEDSEPGFHPLIRALYHAARGEQFTKPRHKPQLSVCQSFLYDYVWNRLDTFLELPMVEKKDVFVAISGIVDLNVHKDIAQHPDLLSECRAAVDLQYPQIRDHLQTYRQFVDDDDGLKEARLEELMKQLKEDMSRFEDDSDEMVTIEILRIL